MEVIEKKTTTATRSCRTSKRACISIRQVSLRLASLLLLLQLLQLLQLL